MQIDYSKAFGKFVKDNASMYSGGFGLAFAANDIKNVVESDHKFTALLKTLKDFLFWRTALAGTFLALGAAIRGLVKDTGSLDAALKRLSAIQGAQKLLAPFVGGKSAARNEVANLLQFSASTPFTFEESVSADRALHTQTRGAFAGTGALAKVGDAAAASGNGLEASAQAVGRFYEALHNGEPIHQAVEEMRQMGLVSDLSANHMIKMAEAGASQAESVNELNRALEESKGGMASYAQELEAVSAAHDKAKESAKAAFGEGFTQAPIESTKNYTKALVAVTPALHDVGQFFAGFTQTLETWGSKITKWTAQSGLLGNAIKAISLAVTVGAIALTVYGAAIIPIVGPVAAFVAGLTALGLVLNSVAHAEKEAARELTRLTQAHREAQAEINAHGAAVQTLTDLHEQYGRSVSHIIDLQNELVEAEKKGDSKKIQEIIRALKEAHAEMAKLPSAQNLASPERGEVERERMEERRDRERQRFQEALAREPGRAGELSEQRAGVLEERAEQGRQGLQLRQRVAERAGNLLPQQADIQTQIGELESADRALRAQGKKLPKEDFQRLEGLKDQLAPITDQFLKIQQIEGKTAAVGTEAQIQRLQHAQNANIAEEKAAGMKEGRDKKDLQREAQRERVMAGGVEAGPDVGRKIQNLQAVLAEQLEDEKNVRAHAEEARELRGVPLRQSREQAVAATEIQLESGAAQARLSGQTRQRQEFQDMGAFLQNFEQLRQLFPKEQARQLAVEKTQAQIAEEAPSAEAFKPLADSLTRIGGGGGVGGPTGDPAQRTRERQAQIADKSLTVLKHIDANTKQGTQEAGGGKPNEAMELPPGAPGTPEATHPEEEQPSTGGGIGAGGGVDQDIKTAKDVIEASKGKPTTTGTGPAILDASPHRKLFQGEEDKKKKKSEVPPAWPPTFSAPASPNAPQASIGDDLKGISQAMWTRNPEIDVQGLGSAATIQRAMEEGRVGTKDHPLPKQPWSPAVKVAPIEAPQSGPNVKTPDYAVIGALNKLVRGNEQSNEHLSTITEQNDKGIA